jgi:DNA-directed RNA polymerase specialized sigma subunit
MDKLPSATLMKMKKDKKIQKYMWVPEILSRMLVSRMPTHTQVEYKDLYAAGLEALIIQMNRLYTEEKLIRRLWNPEKKDLTVGPFFLKNLKTPYITDADTASVKFIKGRILDEMRKLDPATPKERATIKKINKFKRDYENTLNRAPKARVVMEKFGLDRRKYDDLMSVDEVAP